MAEPRRTVDEDGGGGQLSGKSDNPRITLLARFLHPLNYPGSPNIAASLRLFGAVVAGANVPLDPTIVRRPAVARRH